MTNGITETSPLVCARVAGFAYLVTIIIGILNGIFVDSTLIVSGDDAATANNIMANDFLFRIGIAGVLILYAGVVVLSHALYETLKSVNKKLALLAMYLRLAEGILGGVTVLLSFVVLGLLNGADYSTVFTTEQLQAQVGLFLNVRTAGLVVVLVFAGLGGTIFCYLFLKSKCVPRIFSIWGIFTYMSMLILSFVTILMPNHPALFEVVLYGLGALFELLFGIWLLFKGVNVEQWEKHA